MIDYLIASVILLIAPNIDGSKHMQHLDTAPRHEIKPEVFQKFVERIGQSEDFQFPIANGEVGSDHFHVTFTDRPSNERITLDKVPRDNYVVATYSVHPDNGSHAESKIPVNADVVIAIKERIQYFAENDRQHLELQLTDLPRRFELDLQRSRFAPAKIKQSVDFSLLDAAAFYEACVPEDMRPNRQSHSINSSFFGSSFPAYELDFRSNSSNSLKVVELALDGHQRGTAIFMNYGSIQLEAALIERDSKFDGPGSKCAVSLNKSIFGKPMELSYPDGRLSMGAIDIIKIIKGLKKMPATWDPAGFEASF